jgi:hypothetical protein
VNAAEVVERIRLPELVAEVAVELQGLGVAFQRGRVLVGQLLDNAEVAQGVGFCQRVTDLARRVKGDAVECHLLLPESLVSQEVTHGGDDRDGVPRLTAGGSFRRGGLEVEALSFEPGERQVARGKLWAEFRRVADTGVSRGPCGGGLASFGDAGHVQVIIEEPDQRRVPFVGRVVSG